VARGRRRGRHPRPLATEVARILRGKHKPTFAPHIDTGDHVIIVNADKVVLSRNKADASGSTATAATRVASSPSRSPRCSTASRADAVRRTVKGMLPKGRSAASR
jgi:large subunit ribosomal protein L13